MSYHLTNTLPEKSRISSRSQLAKTDPPSKNRVWKFSTQTYSRTWPNHQETPETTSETSVTITITVSGLPFWPSRDPLWEYTSRNLYTFLCNHSVNIYDILGLSKAFIWDPLGWWVQKITLDVLEGDVSSGTGDHVTFSSTITVYWRCHVAYLCEKCDLLKDGFSWVTFTKSVPVLLPDTTFVYDSSGPIDLPAPKSIWEGLWKIIKAIIDNSSSRASKTWDLNKMPENITDEMLPDGWKDPVLQSEPDLPPNSSGMCP